MERSKIYVSDLLREMLNISSKVYNALVFCSSEVYHTGVPK